MEFIMIYTSPVNLTYLLGSWPIFHNKNPAKQQGVMSLKPSSATAVLPKCHAASPRTAAKNPRGGRSEKG